MNGESTQASVNELARLDEQIAAQQAQAVAAHRAFLAADAALRATIARRDGMAAGLRAGAAAAAPPAAGPIGTRGSTPTTAWPVDTAPPAARETSTRTVQNVLFILGGLLLGTAAIVFTAVAWTTFGVQGRAAILGVVTLVALAAPVVALWRKLNATAETVAAIALLLVLLDGFAVWSVNLFDAQTLPGARYAGLVALAVAVVALAYRLLTKLVGPALVALLAIQPVLPLLLVPEPLTGAGWSLVWSSVALVNLGVAWATRDGREPNPKQLPKVARVICRFMSLVLYGTWLAVSALVAVLADLLVDTVADRAQAGGAIVVAAAVFAASTALSRSVLLARCAGAVAVVSLAGAVGGVVAAAWPGYAMLGSALVVLAAALTAAATRRLLPAQVWPGPAVGAAVAAGAVGLFVVVAATFAAITTIVRTGPLWSASLAETGPNPPLATWQLPVAVLAVATAVAVLVPRVQRTAAIAAGGVVGIVVLPASVALVWWAPAMLSLAGVAVTAFVLMLGRSPATTRAAAASALALTLNAVATAGARPALTATVLGGIALLSVILAVLVAAGRDRPSRSAIAGQAVFIGLLAVPPAIGSALVAAQVPAWWAVRGTVIAVGVLVLALGILSGSRWSALARAGYRSVLVGALVWPAVGAVTADESAGIYASVSLLLVALDVAVLTRLDRVTVSTVEQPEASEPATPGGVTADRLLAIIPAGVAGLVLVLSVLLPVLAVVVGPYAWLASVWSGQPSGVGLTPDVTSASDTITDLSGVGADAVALAVLALASAVFGYARTRRPVVALAGLGLGGPTAILLGLVAIEAPWPSVPAATLLIGLLLALVAALTVVPGWRAGVAIVQAVVYIGAGVAGSLVVEWATLAALGAVTVTAAVIGAIGNSRAWRVAGWLVAVGAAVAAAAAAGFAADLPARDASVGVLAVAVVALFVGATVLRPGRVVEANATEAAAHAGAVVAIIFTLGWSGRTALICLLWGVAVGLRALLPGTSRSGRAALAAVAAGFELLAWWLLLTSRGVTLVEAYTVPLALVAFLAGWAALRSRPDLRSWVAYGPALVAGFAPSLAVVLGAEGAPLRRLALGAAALGVVVWGSVEHRQAPVVIGGVVLVLVALHELVLLWQRIPGWIPLALGGLILLGLAITYERRLRDVRSLRTAIGRMT